jgi:hypothetical protein
LSDYSLRPEALPNDFGEVESVFPQKQQAKTPASLVFGQSGPDSVTLAPVGRDLALKATAFLRINLFISKNRIDAGSE